MKEVEIKAKLRDKDTIMKRLADLGCTFEALITQNDKVFVEDTSSIKAFKANRFFLRIRIKNNSVAIFTVKKKGVNDLDSFEHETVIENPDEMEKALLMIGYKEMVRINKTRMITHYNDDEICIDEVEDLGSFIEMERLTEDESANPEDIQARLFEFFKTLGIQEEDRVTSGYDILMLQKNSERNNFASETV